MTGMSKLGRKVADRTSRMRRAPRTTIGLAVAVVAAGTLLTTAGYQAEQVAHPPQQIHSMGEVYNCAGAEALTKGAAESRESSGKLHLVGWVPMTHAVYAVRRAAPKVYVRFGHKYFPCQVGSRNAKAAYFSSN